MKDTFVPILLSFLILAVFAHNTHTEEIPECNTGLLDEPLSNKPALPKAVAQKRFTGAINSMHHLVGTDSLLVLDSTFLFNVNPDNLKRQLIEIRGEKDHLANLWTPKNFAVSANGKLVLVIDKVINAQTGKIEVLLDVKSAITKGLPNPEALDISPDGRLGLVLVHSYSSDQFDTLALFDLTTGKAKHVQGNGNTIRYALFSSDDQLVVFYSNSIISLETLDFKGKARLSDNGPIPIPWGNYATTLHSSDKNWLMVSDGDKITIFDLETHRRVFEDNCSSNPITNADGSLLLYQTVQPSGKLCACGKHELNEIVLKVKDMELNITTEMVMPKQYNPLSWNHIEGVLYCIDHDTLLKIPLPAAAYDKKVTHKKSNQEVLATQ